MLFSKLTSAAILPSLTFAASVRNGPSGAIGGYTWSQSAINGALSYLLSQAANVPGTGPNQLGDVIYRQVTTSGFTAVLFVKSTATGIAADACSLGDLAFQALGTSYERVLTQTDDLSAKFAVFITAFAEQSDTKRNVFDSIAIPEEFSTPVLGKRIDGPYTIPFCSLSKRDEDGTE